MTLRLALAISALVALAVPAGAEECFMTTSVPEVTTCVGPVQVGISGTCEYIDNDPCQPSCVFSIWWYFEANDVPGLQRSDEVKDDTCGGLYPGDFIVS